MALPSFFKQTRNKLGGWIPLSVVPLRRHHIRFWDRHIQPIIAKLGPQVRADANWDWHLLTSLGTLTIPLLQEPKAFAIVYHHPTTKEPIVCAIPIPPWARDIRVNGSMLSFFQKKILMK